MENERNHALCILPNDLLTWPSTCRFPHLWCLSPSDRHVTGVFIAKLCLAQDIAPLFSCLSGKIIIDAKWWQWVVGFFCSGYSRGYFKKLFPITCTHYFMKCFHAMHQYVKFMQSDISENFCFWGNTFRKNRETSEEMGKLQKKKLNQCSFYFFTWYLDFKY